MEVRVAAVEGGSVPEGCVINITVGDTQKQARYDPRKAYRFNHVRKCAKMEVYQLVGACDMTWQAGCEPETQECRLANAGFSLSVTMSRSSAAAAPGKGADAARGDKTEVARGDKMQTASVARKYLCDRGIESMLAEAMKALLKTMPDDARGFLADYFRGPGKPPEPETSELKAQLQHMHREHEQLKAQLGAIEDEAELFRPEADQPGAGREEPRPELVRLAADERPAAQRDPASLAQAESEPAGVAKHQDPRAGPAAAPGAATKACEGGALPRRADEEASPPRLARPPPAVAPKPSPAVSVPVVLPGVTTWLPGVPGLAPSLFIL